MIVKVNKKGGDCGCNKKLAKGGCAPKKKKIKKNKNGGFLAIGEIPIYGNGNEVYKLEGDDQLHKDNKVKKYKKEQKEQTDTDPGYYEYVETATLHPQEDLHGRLFKTPILQRTVKYPQGLPTQADTAVVMYPDGINGRNIIIPRFVTGSDTLRTPQWNFINKKIDAGKQLKK